MLFVPFQLQHIPQKHGKPCKCEKITFYKIVCSQFFHSTFISNGKLYPNEFEDKDESEVADNIKWAKKKPIENAVRKLNSVSFEFMSVNL